jgi:hypothetical protein
MKIIYKDNSLSSLRKEKVKAIPEYAQRGPGL